MTLQEFLDSPVRNAHIEYKNFENLYVRKSTRYIYGKMYHCFDIATVAVKPGLEGKGLFRFLFLKLLLMQTRPIFVENVLDPKFGEVLLRMGFVEHGDTDPKCYMFLRSYGKMEINRYHAP